MKRISIDSLDEDIPPGLALYHRISIKKGEIVQVFGKIHGNRNIWIHVIGEQYVTEETFFQEKAYLCQQYRSDIEFDFEAEETEDVIFVFDNMDSFRTSKDVSVTFTIMKPERPRKGRTTKGNMLERIKQQIVSNHFYLQNEALSDFSREAISKANHEIIAVNPYVDKGNLTQELVKASQAGVDVTIVTRNPLNDMSMSKSKRTNRQSFHKKLANKDITLHYDNSVHAKILIVDHSVAIISSMNLYAHSSGGGTWEAGIGTKEPAMIEKIKTSLSEVVDLESASQRTIADYDENSLTQRCIDCGISIPKNPHKPRCISCWRRMVRRSN